MKSKKFLEEIKGLSKPELVQKARSISEEMLKIRFKKVTGQAEQGGRKLELRRNLARVKMILAEKSRNEASKVA